MKKNIFIIALTMILTLGISYAYFTANLTGVEEGTTITVTGGSLSIAYDGGEDIVISDILPADNPAAIKTFTVTGNNTTDLTMYYELNLIVEDNSFSDGALKYRLLSTNNDNNGEVVPSIEEITNIDTGSSVIELGMGSFVGTTGGNVVHTYNLEIYFPNTGGNQNEDQDKEINAYVHIKNAY